MSDREIQQFKETVLKDFPRLKETDRFTFNCHRGLKCFTQCCGDVSIALSPYDIIRMKNALGISSEEFLAKYTFVPFNAEQRIPVVMLRMKDDEKKLCPFVSEEGCGIYADRPWACRMYPLGMASPKDAREQGEPFYFLMKERPCDGFEEDRTLTVREWLEEQGILEYNKWGESFKEITLHNYLLEGGNLNPSKMEMFYTGCYNLDKFRRLIFESSFLDKFEVLNDEIERIRNDDVSLMLFSFKWLKFSLFGEPTIKVKDIALRKKREELSKKQ
jgi:Fe-S-cluster containining protein